MKIFIRIVGIIISLLFFIAAAIFMFIGVSMVNESEKSSPIDSDFNNMKEFDLDTVDKENDDTDTILNYELEKDEKIDVIVNKSIKENGNVEYKGDSKSIIPSKLDNNSIFIPSISLFSKIDKTGKLGTFDDKGYMVLPRNSKSATQWKNEVDINDDSGTVLIAAHRGLGGYKGVFVDLVKIQPGAIAYVSNSKGDVQPYMVKSLEAFNKTILPQDIFENSINGPKELILITCGGDLIQYDNSRYNYDTNVVATFVPII